MIDPLIGDPFSHAAAGIASAGNQGGRMLKTTYIGYYESYAESHEALDRDTAVQDLDTGLVRAGRPGDLSDAYGGGKPSSALRGREAQLERGVASRASDGVRTRLHGLGVGLRQGLTPFLTLAQNAGVKRLADGVGMLVEQASEALLEKESE